MRFGSLVFAALLLQAACGGKSKPTQTAPLPEETKAAETTSEKPAEPAEPAEPPAPTGPVELSVPAPDTKVKLVSKGKGKLAPLRYSGKAGGKQQVELAMDFSAKQSVGAQSQEQVIPTIVLAGEAETKAVEADGKAEYAFTVTGIDARDVPGSSLPAAEFKSKALGSLTGLVIGGTLAPNGIGGETKLRIEKPDPMSASALELVHATLPSWPVLPDQPVGVGAKWQATTATTLADKVVVTQVTDYELVSKKGATWTIKGKTKISGADQDISGGKITGISGTGTTEVTVTDGALLPSYKSTSETQFTASEKDASMQFVIKSGGALTAK
ncbi:MAG: hypothetical protein ACTHU0_15075 [Kofleriaceae bacterium]